MKIGIITFHRAHNYGAVLQAFALRKTLTNLGHDAEIIDYGKMGESARFDLAMNGIKPFIAAMLINLLSIGNADIRRYRFRKFRKNKMGISASRYINSNAIHKTTEIYDLFITGSDQVWNPFLNHGDLTYLLDFVKEPAKKMSYAASFGVSSIPSKVKEIYIKKITGIKYLSARETVGQRIIKELTNRESKVTLDPTLLIDADEWNKIAKPYKASKPYILCFTIMGDPIGFMDFCRHLSNITGYKIINIANPVRKLHYGIKSIATAGPPEFLGLFKNASIVVTNSFHGTAFSIIYKKPFYTFLYNSDRDIRLKEITNKLDLKDRLISEVDNLPSIDNLGINFLNVQKKLNILKENSLSFLQKSIC